MSVDLDRDLGRLAQRLDVGDPDRLVDDVMRRIASPGRERTVRTTPGTSGVRRFALAGVALAALLVVAVGVVPASRRAVADFFGIGNTRIERPSPTSVASGSSGSSGSSSTSNTDPSVPPPPTAGAAGGGAGFPAELRFGEPVSAEAATAETGLEVPGSPRLGSPAAVFVTHPPAAGQIVVVYAPSDELPATPVAGVGALLSVASGDVEEGLFLKIAEPGTTVSDIEITVASGARVPAIWLSGDPHQYAFEAADGTVVFETLRLATNTLLWTDGGVVHRLESSLALDEAVAVAATVTTA